MIVSVLTYIGEGSYCLTFYAPKDNFVPGTALKHMAVVDIIEFPALAICNGFNPFKGCPYRSFSVDGWEVNYGRAELSITKLKKAIMQRP